MRKPFCRPNPLVWYYDHSHVVRTGRSESTKSAEIPLERSGGAPRPEPEIALPEAGDALRAGPRSRF